MELQRLAEIVEKNCLLNRNQPVVVGVSGGPDSLCLLHLLARLQIPLVVAHFDHQLREESKVDSAQVESEAARLGLPFLLGSQDVAAYAAEKRFTIEEAARVLRYRFLFAQAKEQRAQAVAVGHTADDQVETVLMHFLRGAGLAGLRGMAYRSMNLDWDADIPLVRPLLSFWREDSVAYCLEQGLNPVQDASNQDRTFLRNRIRHELIPYLGTYNPQIRGALLRMSQVLAGEETLAQRALEMDWQGCFSAQVQNSVKLKLAEVRSLPSGSQRAVLRKAMVLLLPGLRDVDFTVVERAERFLAKPSAGQVDLVRGLCMFAEGQTLVITRTGEATQNTGWPQLDFKDERPLEIPGSIELPSGWQLSSQWVEDQELPVFDGPNPGTAWEAWLDSARLSGPVVLRCPRPGDRFQPLGMQGHSMKLSDFWINQKHPRRARAAWPLVLSNNQILWVPGFRPADPFQLQKDTRRALHLRLVRVPD